MSPRELPCPLFGADNHLYETQEAMTKYLPRQYRSAIQHVQVNGPTENGSVWLAPLRNQLADVCKKSPESFPGDAA